jgi:Mg2+/Co2+ transporter CorB
MPEATAARAAPLDRLVVRLLSPIVALVRFIVRGVLRLFGLRIDPGSAMLSVREEIVGALALGHAEGAVEKEDRDRLLGALDLGDRTVEEIMLHRSAIEMIDADAPPEDILSQALASPHTRLPVFKDDRENIVGLIHAKDLLRAHRQAVARARCLARSRLAAFNMLDIAMDPYFVPETTTLDDQMREFLRRKSHFALVVDEYGALRGLITLEDILEEIVGEIADEFDIDAEHPLREAADGSLIVDGAMTIRDLNRATGLGAARRGGQHGGGPGDPRGPDDPQSGPGLCLSRLPLRGAGAQGKPGHAVEDTSALAPVSFSLRRAPASAGSGIGHWRG